MATFNGMAALVGGILIGISATLLWYSTLRRDRPNSVSSELQEP